MALFAFMPWAAASLTDIKILVAALFHYAIIATMDTSGDEAQGSVCQRPLHHPNRWSVGRSGPRNPKLSIRALHAERTPGTIPLGASFGRLLRQSQRPASRDLGLLSAGALGPSSHHQRRPAGLSAISQTSYRRICNLWRLQACQAARPIDEATPLSHS